MNLLVLLLLLGSLSSSAALIRYPSGKLREFASDLKDSQKLSLAGFLNQHYAHLPSGFEWKEVKNISDNTHTHLLFEYRVHGRKLLDRYLKLSLDKSQFVEFARSNLKETVFPIREARVRLERDRNIQGIVSKDWRERGWSGTPKLSTQKVYWWDEGNNSAIAALEVETTSSFPVLYETLIVREWDGHVLERKKTWDALTANIYPIHPDRTPLTQATLPNSDYSQLLYNRDFAVVRAEISENVVFPDPRIDFSASFSTDPGNYNSACTGDGTACPNASFDAINAFFHLSRFRTNMNNYFGRLGLPNSFANDRIIVVTNYPIKGDGQTQAVNNAFYKTSTSGSTTYHYVVFQPPAPEGCYSNTDAVAWYSFAREAPVFLHELQHYFTHQLVDLVRSSPANPKLTGAISEGSSDYFAASFQSFVSNTDITNFLEYSGKHCDNHKRDAAQIFPFDNTKEFNEEHHAGRSWSSGLWKLRQLFGRDYADMVAIKTLLFLSPDPTFTEAVESIVRADRALYGGHNTGAIRSVFYDELHFYGGDRMVFQDGEKQIMDMGFSSCVGVSLPRTSTRTIPLLLLFFLFPIFIGRRLRFFK